MRVSLILASALATLAKPISSSPISSEPIPPTKDPWYTAPSNWQHAHPGTILRRRTAPGNITTIFNTSSAVYNLLYRTTDSQYRPSWAVTTLLVPKASSTTTNSSALLSYQIPYNSPDIDAGPSYSLYAPITPLSAITYDDINSALSKGWYVSVPDFETHTASFTVGITEGHAVLDSVRAALTLVSESGCRTETIRTALWGFSGGSLASEWAAELQAAYAPELHFAGVALGGTVPNITQVLQLGSGQWWTGLIPLAAFGITAEYPDARAYLLSQLKATGPYNATGFSQALNLDVGTAFTVYAGQPVYEYFVDGIATFDAPVIKKITDNNGHMGYHGIPQMPLYVYKSVQDEIAPIGAVDELVARYCNVGVNIVYERNSIGGHLAEETNGDARARTFLEQVLSGSYSHTGCTIRDVAVNITDSPL